MDAIIFGTFLKERRTSKSLTQAELADQLHVTAKAVSRWERGVGFPDIQTLEPLARALDVSLLELMQSRLIQEQTVTSEEASAAVADALTLAGGNRLTRILRWTEKASAIFAMAAMGFLSIILDKYVVGTWMRTASKLALVLMFLTTGAVYFLRQAAQSPSRPTRYQLTRWGLTALALLALLLSIVLGETVGRSAKNRLSVLGMALLCARNCCHPQSHTSQEPE